MHTIPTKNKGGRYKFDGFIFDWHDWLGACKLKKDGMPAARSGFKFFDAIDRWLNLTDDEREQTRFDY
jgi:hypothetical protein